jgi:tetratricopeptide (TPR) repeat protein
VSSDTWAQCALLLCSLLLFGGVVGADARAALQNAALLVEQGRLEEADRQARQALSDPETKAAAYSVLGVIRLQQKRLEDSASFLEKAIALEPRLLGAHLNLAHVYTLQGKPDRALGLFRRALKLDPSSAAAASALEAFRQSPDGMLVLAGDALKRGDRAEAAGLATDWARVPDVPEPLSIRFALTLVQGGLVSEGIDILERLRQRGPASYEVAFNLGSAYVVKGDSTRALEAYDVALGLQPDSMVALRQAAVVAERAGELERSLSYWMRAKKIEPGNAEVLLGFGRVCLRMDLLEDAEPALTEAARLKPADPSYQYTLAAAKVGKRQYEAAQSLLEPLVRKEPQDPHLQYALGAVLYAQGRLDEASVRLEESIRLLPEQLAAHYYLALAARDQGNDAEAIAILEKLLARHPDHAAACEALGGLLTTAQRYTEAETNLRKAIQLNPSSVRANYQLGLVLARMGRKEEADKQLEFSKTLREEDAATSRLQLRLLDPDQTEQ